MLHRGIMFLMIMTIIGCSQQPESIEKRSKSESRGFSFIQILHLVILPENPSSVTPLQVSMQFRGGEPESVEYQWLRNGEPIPGAIWPTLEAEYVRKGDFIAVTVRAKQPGGNGDEQNSDTVIIGNTKPLATFAGVQPGTPTSGEKLKALGVGYDHDSDTVTFVYQWIVNGEPVVGQDEQFLATSHFRRGDRVQVAVTPYDGEEFGMILRSAPIVVGNSPPEIVSAPPAHLEDGTFHYAVQTVDVDGDPVKFSLEGETPAGLEIAPATGLIQWEPVRPKSEATYVFQVVAEDPEGAKSVQQITLNYKPGA
jgi:Putative Ig domain